MRQIYESAEQFEDLFIDLFARIESADGHAFDDVVKRRMVVRFRVTEPDVTMVVDGTRRQASLSFGPSDARATLTVDVTANSLHEVLLGTMPLGKALSSRRLRVKGSKLKAIRLQGVFHAFQSVYPALARERLDGE